MGNLEVISFLRHPLCLSSGHFPAAYLRRDAALRDNTHTQCPPPWRNLHLLNYNGRTSHRHTRFLVLSLRTSLKGRVRWQPSTQTGMLCARSDKCETCSTCCIIVALVTVIILFSYWDIRELAWSSSKKGS